MAVTFQNLGASANPDINDPNDQSSYSNSAWTPPTSGLILLFVFGRAVSGTSNTPTVSGNNVTWVEIATISPAGAYTLTLLAANASGSSNGATTIDFAGQTQHFCRASFFHADGVDLSGGVAAAFVQAPTDGDTGTATSGSVTLSAAGSSDNRPICAFAHAANEATAPRTNWTEADDIAGSFINTAIESQWRDDAFETTASATWVSSVSWLGIAAELKADTGAGTPASASQPAYLSGPFVASDNQPAYLKGATDGSPATLRAYWKLEEGSSETTFVEEIAGHDASLTVGDVSQVAGKVGNAQRHDGNAAVRLSIADHADFHFQLSQGFSFGIWFRTNTNADNNFQPFFGVVQSADDENVYYYGYWNWEGTGENILWGVHTDDGDSFQDWNVQPGILGDDQWHFAVFVLSPTHRAIWIDGQLDRVTVHASDFNGDITGQGNTLSVGIFSRRVVSPETIAFDGDQDEIALWEGCLTEEEITLLYNNGNGRDYREVVSSQPAYLVGGINVQDNQSAYLSGIDTSVDSQGAYLAGKETLSDSQLAFTKGQDDEVSSKEAYLESADTFFDSQPAYLTGQSAGELLRPNGFIANLGNKWHQFPGGASTPLYTVIDEETPDDADYVVHDTPPLQVGDYFEVSLNNPSGTPGSGDHIIRWRARRRGTGAVSITVELRQGASTVIASQEQALTDTDTTYELALSAGEIASISNYDDLRFRWTVTGVG